jgi:hypothetical protein
MQNVEWQIDAIERTLQRFAELARLGDDTDREKVRRARELFEQGREELVNKYEAILGEVDLSCDVCVARACLTMRPKLAEIRDRLCQVHQDLISEESAIRLRIATAKRIGVAIRVTDRALVKAARLAKKTESGTEAFPGLRRAFELQEESKQALASGRLEVAMKLTLRARDLIGETMKEALDSAEVAAVRERVIEFWKETSEIIKRLENRIDEGQNPKAARLVEMAKQEQEKARELAQDYPYRAFRHAKAARRIVSEMLRFQQRAENCEDRSARLAQRIDDAKEIVEESGDAKAAVILEDGVSHFEKGQTLCEQGNAAQATVQFDIAAKLTAKAVDIANGNTPRTHALNREIRKTTLIVKKAAGLAETEARKKKVEAAEKLVESAAGQMDNPKACLRLLDKATDLAFSVIAEAGRDEAQDNPGQEDK